MSEGAPRLIDEGRRACGRSSAMSPSARATSHRSPSTASSPIARSAPSSVRTALEWLCLPRIDGPSVFGAMLDRDAGGFSLAPVDVTVPAGRRYLPGTNVIETTWMTRTGWLIVADALTIGPWHDDEERRETFVRSPTDHRSEKVLLRTITCANGRSTWSSTANRYSSTGSARAEWSYSAGRLRRGARPARGIRSLAAAYHRPAAGPRGAERTRAPDDERGRDRSSPSPGTTANPRPRTSRRSGG